jgi:ribonuclease BN (tRNA processing enzyme)
MKDLRVLGCSGGIGGARRHLRTSSFLVDHDILIDAGTGVAELSVAELAAIDHVFLTHAHLDHIASLPLMIDTVADLPQRTADRLRHPGGARQSAPAHLQLGDLARFHRAVPDASNNPFMRYQPIDPGKPVVLGGREITALPVEHTVPAVAYQPRFRHRQSGLFRRHRAMRRVLAGGQPHRQPAPPGHRMRILQSRAEIGRGFPSPLSRMLAAELAKLERGCELHITHLKPGQIEATMSEIEACLGDYGPNMLQNNEVFEF